MLGAPRSETQAAVEPATRYPMTATWHKPPGIRRHVRESALCGRRAASRSDGSRIISFFHGSRVGVWDMTRFSTQDSTVS